MMSSEHPNTVEDGDDDMPTATVGPIHVGNYADVAYRKSTEFVAPTTELPAVERETAAQLDKNDIPPELDISRGAHNVLAGRMR